MNQETYIPVRWFSQKCLTPEAVTDEMVREMVNQPVVSLIAGAKTRVFMLDVQSDIISQLKTTAPLPIETVYFCQSTKRFAAAILNRSLLLLRESLVHDCDSTRFRLQPQRYLGVVVASKSNPKPTTL